MIRHIPLPMDKGEYSFAGQPALSKGISLTLSEQEIQEIVSVLHQYIDQQGGTVDFIQVFRNHEGVTVHAIANPQLEEKESDSPQKDDPTSTPQPQYILKLADEQLDPAWV